MRGIPFNYQRMFAGRYHMHSLMCTVNVLAYLTCVLLASTRSQPALDALSMLPVQHTIRFTMTVIGCTVCLWHRKLRGVWDLVAQTYADLEKRASRGECLHAETCIAQPCMGYALISCLSYMLVARCSRCSGYVVCSTNFPF